VDNLAKSAFTDQERGMMAEIARRLSPSVEALAKRWADAVKLDAPAEKLAQMRETLTALNTQVLSGFFERLSEENPEGALALYERFIEDLIQRQLDEPHRQRATIESLFASARIVRRMLNQEIDLALNGDANRAARVRLSMSKLWGRATESLGLIYSRLQERHLQGLYDNARRRERELMAARDAALESSRLKSAFLANMSHEIHTPLNIILGYADLMAERLAELGYDCEAYAEPVRRAGKRLLDTIGAILEVSRIESGNYKLEPRALDLAEFLNRLLEEFRVLAAKKGLELRLDIQMHALVTFDERCLSNALTNLLQNAIKFTERGYVAIRLYRDEAGVPCLQVRDTGVGIDPAFLPRVFEAFSQENPGLTRRFEGVGLGMALVRKYLELNGAEITVASQKGMGSTFTIRFLASAPLQTDSPRQSIAR
jgi:signal transduction histidine kinase